MNTKTYQYITLEGTRDALIVRLVSPNIYAADEILGIGRELLTAADLAASIAMPLVLSFDGVESISSALIGKLVLLQRKARSNGITVRYTDLSPDVNQVIRRTTRSID